MRIFIPFQLLRDTTVMHLKNLSTSLGAKEEKSLDGVWINYSMAGEKMVTKDDFDTALSLVKYGLRIENAHLTSEVLSRGKLDNKVPKTWEHALIADDTEDPESSRTKEWQEYTRTYDYGDDNCVIWFGIGSKMQERANGFCNWVSAHKTPVDGGYRFQTHEQLIAYLEHFKDKETGEYLYMVPADFEAWKAANEPVEAEP